VRVERAGRPPAAANQTCGGRVKTTLTLRLRPHDCDTPRDKRESRDVWLDPLGARALKRASGSEGSRAVGAFLATKFIVSTRRKRVLLLLVAVLAQSSLSVWMCKGLDYDRSPTGGRDDAEIQECS